MRGDISGEFMGIKKNIFFVEFEFDFHKGTALDPRLLPRVALAGNKSERRAESRHRSREFDKLAPRDGFFCHLIPHD
jgi:hypothetical protein